MRIKTFLLGYLLFSEQLAAAPNTTQVPNTLFSPIAANSIYANFTASLAAPAIFTFSNCSGANQASNFTTGTGFGCVSNIALTTAGLNQFSATTSAQLAGVISDGTGTGSLVFNTSPIFITQITDPLIIGGTIAGATLTLRSTSNGSPSGDSIIFVTGGATHATLYSSGGFGIGPTAATLAAGEIGIPKESASGSAPGAGVLKLAAVAGTSAGTCKIIAYAGTSTTPITIVDNVGGGC